MAPAVNDRVSVPTEYGVRVGVVASVHGGHEPEYEVVISGSGESRYFVESQMERLADLDPLPVGAHTSLAGVPVEVVEVSGREHTVEGEFFINRNVKTVRRWVVDRHRLGV